MPKEYLKSEEAAYRRALRSFVRASKLTRTEQEITIVILNLWMVHRHGEKGFIHPSKRLIAKRARCSRTSVVNCLRMLRGEGVLIIIKNANGGGHLAPHYRMNIEALLFLCDPTLGVQKGGQNCTPGGVQKSYGLGVQNLHPVYRTAFDRKDGKTNTPKKQTGASADNPFIWMNGEAVGNA